MKTLNYLLLALLLSGIVIGCNKDDDDDNNNNNTPQITCELQSTSETGGPYNESEEMTYDSSGQLVKTKYTMSGLSGYEWDTITYNTSGDVLKVERYYSANPGTPFKTLDYSYHGVHLNGITETEIEFDSTYITTYSFTNPDGDITAATIAGSHDGGSWQNAVYSGGNLTSADYDFGDTLISLTITYDNKENVERHYYPDGDNIITYFNNNNMTLVTFTNETVVDTTTYAAGSTFYSQELTYNSNNEVETLIEGNMIFDNDTTGTTKVTTYTYICE